MTLVAWSKTIQDEAGNAVPGAEIEVRRESDGGLATLFSDKEGNTALANPFTTGAGAGGLAQFWSTPDAYTVEATANGDSMTWSVVLSPPNDVQSSDVDTTVGRLMTVGAFGLGAANPSAITDFTASLRPGFYRYNEATATGAPGPGSSFQGFAIVLRAVSGATMILAGRQTAVSSSQRFWLGTRTGETGTITWQQLYHLANALGTVAQSGGIPTGAIAEFGSNANGSYVRYLDGTQICWRNNISVTLSSAAAVAWTGTFPAAFSGSTTALFATGGGGNSGENDLGAYFCSTRVDGGAPEVRLRHNENTVRSDTLTFDYLAIGRWY